MSSRDCSKLLERSEGNVSTVPGIPRKRWRRIFEMRSCGLCLPGPPTEACGGQAWHFICGLLFAGEENQQRLECLTKLFLWILSHIKKGKYNNPFASYSVKYPCLGRKLQPSNVTHFNLSNWRIVFKKLKDFIGLFNKLSGGRLAPFFIYVVNDWVEVPLGLRVTKTCINTSS